MDQRKDLAVAGAVVLGGAALTWAAQEISLGRIRDPLGSRALPTITGLLILGLGIALVVRRLVTWDRSSHEVIPDGSEDLPGFPAATWRSMATWGGCFVYATLLLPRFGFLLATPLLLVGLMLLLGVRGYLKVPAIAVVSTVVLFTLFGEALNIRVPLGPLDPYVPH